MVEIHIQDLGLWWDIIYHLCIMLCCFIPLAITFLFWFVFIADATLSYTLNLPSKGNGREEE